MEKLQNTIIRCTGVLCGTILFAHGFLITAIAAVIIGLVIPALLKQLMPDILDAMKEKDGR